MHWLAFFREKNCLCDCLAYNEDNSKFKKNKIKSFLLSKNDSSFEIFASILEIMIN